MAIKYMSFGLFVITIFSCLFYITAEDTTKSKVLLGGECEAIRISFCQKLAYNETAMPNYFGHKNQDEAAEIINQYAPFLRLPGCQSAFRWFLCLQYIPVCTASRRIFPPCRSVCEEAQKDCEPEINKSGFQLESLFNCDSFPTNVSSVEDPCIAII